MKKFARIFLCVLPVAIFLTPVWAATFVAPRGTAVAALTGATAPRASDYLSPTSYNAMSPYMNNTMRNTLQPTGAAGAVDPSAAYARAALATPNSQFIAAQNAAPVAQTRRVVARSGVPVTAARAAVAPVAQPGGVAVARSAGVPSVAAPTARRVVARAGMTTAPMRATNTVGATTNNGRPTNATTSVQTQSGFVADVSSAQCLADYSACMDDYCERADELYNRCFCSAQLPQIDSTYRPAIDAALQRILIAQGTGTAMTDAEIEQLWHDTFAADAWNGDAMSGLNAALNIDWPTSENTMAGQNAFVMGHSYCVQNLRACANMASNLRDVYRSTISRDCATYDKYLSNLKTAAETAASAAEAAAQ